jgi:hypothetical protein
MNKSFLAVLPLVAFSVIGCDEKPAAPAKPATPTKPAATTGGSTPTPAPTGGASLLDNAKNQAAAATNSTAASATTLREQAVAAISTKYDAIKQQISGLKEKAPTVPALTKSTYDSAMTTIEGYVKEAEAKLAELKAAASGDTVTKAKEALDGIITKITDAIGNAQKMLTPK